MTLVFTLGSLESFISLHLGPWPDLVTEEAAAAMFPATAVAGGEGE